MLKQVKIVNIYIFKMILVNCKHLYFQDDIGDCKHSEKFPKMWVLAKLVKTVYFESVECELVF